MFRQSSMIRLLTRRISTRRIFNLEPSTSFATIVDASQRRLTVQCRQFAAAAFAHRPDPKETVGDSASSIASAIEELDVDLSLRGRVDSEKFKYVLERLKQSPSPITNDQGKFLLHCCGEAMFGESPQSRSALLEKAWNLLPALGVDYTIVHFNSLLSSWWENQNRFSVVDFLSRLEKHSDSVQPDATTYQYLVMRYCMDGDIQGATTVLEEMKSKDYGIDEHVFNALVYCYSKNGDTEGVKNVLNAMNSASVQVTSTTYYNMALPFAEKGDIERVKRIADESAGSNVMGLNERDVFNLVVVLCTNGHSKHLPEILDLLPRKPASTFKAHQTAYRLIMSKKYDDAILVSRSAHKTQREQSADDPANDSIGYVIYSLMAIQPPARLLTGFLDYLIKTKQHDRPYERALYSALKHHNEAGAFELADEMNKRYKKQPRPSYFYPLLVDQSKSTNMNELIELLERIHGRFSIIFTHRELMDFVFHGSSERIEEFKDTVQRVLMTTNRTSDEQRFGGKLLRVFDPLEPRTEPRTMVEDDGARMSIVEEESSIEDLLKNLEKIPESNGNPKIIWKRLIVAYCQKNDATNAQLYYASLRNSGASISSTFVDEVVDAVSSVEESSTDLAEFVKRLTKETGFRIRRKSVASEESEKAAEDGPVQEVSIEDLLKELENVQSSNGNPKVIWKRLTVAYCQKNDGTNAELYYDALRNSGASISRPFVNEMMNAISSVDERSEDLTTFLKRLTKETGQRIRRKSVASDETEKSMVDETDREASIEDLLKALAKVQASNGNPKSVWKRLIVAYCQKNDGKNAQLYYDALRNSGASIGGPFVNEMMEAISSVKQFHPDLERFLQRLAKDTGQRIRRQSMTIEEMEKPAADVDIGQDTMTVEQMEAQLDKLKSEGLNYKSPLRRLINKYAGNKNYAGVLKSVKELDELGAELSNSILRAVLCASVSFASNPAEAESLAYAEKTLFALIKQSQIREVLGLFGALARDGMIADAVYLLNFLGQHRLFAAKLDMRTTNYVMLAIDDVVSNLIDNEKATEANAIMKAAVGSGFMKPNAKRLKSILDGLLDSEDFVGAVELFTSAAEKFGMTAAVQRLMSELVTCQNAKLLQKVYDHQQKVMGETDAKFRLVMALCHCGKPESASKVWAAVDAAIPTKTLQAEFEYYSDPETYKNLIKICQASSKQNFNQSFVYEALFDVYRKRRDWKSAMSTWAQMEYEKKLTPTTELYRLYARILRESNRPIPSEIEYLARNRQ